ncbi:Rieske (2Fe-2S) protein [Algoriphagus limi]|uniref:Rieske (2Fe-2S) protein n=1 Tax=Algoriphagus limi TaxID=2975273 RepID=A0ABT2G9S7_9BACT|nr:Rieske (2Fe-2S) protein [Algoriphagus limi]MCS5490765.1 Rieske (2Fe-2S) protein [Algoriphagus limi]
MKNYQLGSSRDSALSLFPNRTIKRVRLGEKEIGVIRIEEEFFAFDPSCPHRGASLLQGRINGSGEIICPLHEYRFELKTGQVKAGLCPDLPIYPAQLTEEGLLISI